jgi:hypothetical protein
LFGESSDQLYVVEVEVGIESPASLEDFPLDDDAVSCSGRTFWKTTNTALKNTWMAFIAGAER